MSPELAVSKNRRIVADYQRELRKRLHFYKKRKKAVVFSSQVFDALWS